MIFPEALESAEEYAAYAREVRAPLLANMTEFGKTANLTAAELQELGYKAVIFPASALRVALYAMRDFYRDLKQTGTQAKWLDRMMTRSELYELVDYDAYIEAEREFVGKAVPPLS